MDIEFILFYFYKLLARIHHSPFSGTIVLATPHHICKYCCNFVVWAGSFTLCAGMSAVFVRVTVSPPLRCLLLPRPRPLCDLPRPRPLPRPQPYPLWYPFPYPPCLSLPSMRSLMDSMFASMVDINVAMDGSTCWIVFVTGAVGLSV